MTKMKKYCNILTAVLALCLLSCAKETPVEVEQTDLPPVEEYDPWLAHPREVPSIPGPGPVLMAGNSTKSQLVQDGEDHYDVQWTAGDTFTMLGIQYDNTIYGAGYSTTYGGTEAEFTSMYGLGDPVELHAIYPDSQFLGITDVYVDEVEYLGLCIDYPTVQTATPGSVAEGANLSYAHPGSLSEKLGFTNLVSIIKFRLEGTQASAVTSVTFRGMNNLAGGYILYYQDGRPQVLTNVEISGKEKSRTVTLQGTFAAGQDYYIAITPSRQEAFSMIFANADGETTTLTSTTEMNFNRSQINDFGTITIDEFTDEPASDTPEAIQVKTASVPDVKPVSLIIIPDGFTADELDDYELKARSAVSTLFSVEPFKTYQDYFNVWILKVASNESGASVTDGQGNITEPVDNYFGSRMGASSYGDLDADVNTIYSFVQQYCPDLADYSHTNAETPVLILINDTRYGGIAHTHSNGMTYCQVPITDRLLGWSYPTRKARTDAIIENPTLENDLIDTPQWERDEVGSNTGTWLNTMVHEFGGHSFGRLGDEYWYDNMYKTDRNVAYQSWTVPFNLNLTGDPDNPIWKDILLDSNGAVRAELQEKDPLYAQRIGAFQGGEVSPFNRWRSERISCMIDNRFYFSTYQRYLIVQRIHTLAGDSIADPDERFADFLDKDVIFDPVRDAVASPVIGVSNAIPPRPVPMLPPPRMMD